MRARRAYPQEKARNDLTEQMAIGLSLEEGVRVCSMGSKEKRKGIPGSGNSPRKGITVVQQDISPLGNLSRNH